MTERFTEKYLEYANEFTDCPDPFLLWGALLAISASLSRCVYVEAGSWNISPHIWVVLIGKSSSHKSTAISIVEDLIEQVDPERSAPAEFTSEAILQSLSKSPIRLFIFDEAKSFFDMLGKKYNESLKSLFTILYRKPCYSRSTIKHGVLSVKNAYLPMGMATTPEWLRQSLQDAEQSAMSGFLARFLMVPFVGNGNAPMALPPPHNSDKFKALSEMLWEYKKIEQVFHYTPEAKAKLAKWYVDTTERENKALPLLGPFFEHFKNEAIHKLCILFAVDRGEQEITLDAFREASLCLRYVEDMLPGLVQDMTDNKWDIERRKIISYIQKRGICRRESLADDIRIHGENLTRHLKGLEADDLILMRKEKATTHPIWMLEWVGKIDGSVMELISKGNE
jgi:DNA-binding HxlR family transcriptional regulator